MRLFRRTSPKDPRQVVDDFWRWWVSEGAEGTARAIDEGSLEAWADELAARVDAVDPELAWELSPGATSRHVLVVTAEGDPAVRPTARRWRRAAPPPDAVWEYSDVRLPASKMDWTLTLDGRALDADAVRALATSAGSSLDVVIHHPEMAQMAERTRDQAAFLLLDTALGEAAVETWIGTVRSSAAPVASGVDLSRLRKMVAALEAEHTNDEGEPSWAVLEATNQRGAPVLALTRVPLRPMTAPHLDTHVGISLRFADVEESGLPGERSLTALRALEDHLIERLGDSGQVVAHETTTGVRMLHLYVDSTTPAVDQIKAALGGWAESRPRVDIAIDPAWDAVRHLRT